MCSLGDHSTSDDKLGACNQHHHHNLPSTCVASNHGILAFLYCCLQTKMLKFVHRMLHLLQIQQANRLGLIPNYSQGKKEAQ